MKVGLIDTDFFPRVIGRLFEGFHKAFETRRKEKENIQASDCLYLNFHKQKKNENNKDD